MMVFNRLAVVLAATVTGLMSVVTLSAAPAGGATAAGATTGRTTAGSPDSSRVFVTGLGTPAVGNWNFVTVADRA